MSQIYAKKGSQYVTMKANWRTLSKSIIISSRVCLSKEILTEAPLACIYSQLVLMVISVNWQSVRDKEYATERFILGKNAYSLRLRR